MDTDIVTHVIFDVDGTILDTEFIYSQAKQKVNIEDFILSDKCVNIEYKRPSTQC